MVQCGSQPERVLLRMRQNERVTFWPLRAEEYNTRLTGRELMAEPIQAAGQCVIAIAGGGVAAHTIGRGRQTPPDFRFEIRPILSKNCFACHGPDEGHRQADLRLDDREVAVDFGAIVPGAPDESELVRRITSDDPDERMPPAETGRTLTARGNREDPAVDRRRGRVLAALVV